MGPKEYHKVLYSNMLQNSGTEPANLPAVLHGRLGRHHDHQPGVLMTRALRALAALTLLAAPLVSAFIEACAGVGGRRARRSASR